jgi:hypothetical protein
MMSRGLVHREASSSGIFYRAGEFAETFIASLTSPYLVALRGRAAWVAEAFSDMGHDTFRETMRAAFGRWIEEFQSIERSLAGEHD